MLPGSASAVLDTIHNVVRNCLSDEKSSVTMSSTNQVYQSLANLVRWSDVILINGDKALDKDSIRDVIKTVDSAIKALVELEVEKLKSKDAASNGCPAFIRSPSQNGSQLNGERLSLDNCSDSTDVMNVPLSKRELEILENTSIKEASTLGHSISSDSILSPAQSSQGDFTPPPPPKPPRPDGKDGYRSADCLLEVCPPPPALPPKTKPSGVINTFVTTRIHPPPSATQAAAAQGDHNDQNDFGGTLSHFDTNRSADDRLDEWSKSRLKAARDWMSPTRRSPTSLSSLSASASSLESTLNRSSDDLLLADGQIAEFRVNNVTSSSSCSSYSSRQTSHQTLSFSNQKLQQDVEKRMRGLSCFTQSASSGVFSMSSLSDHVNGGVTSTSNSSATSGVTTSMSVSVQEAHFASTSTSYSSTAGPNSPSSTSVEVPPAIPPKRRVMRERTPSLYDNVPEHVAAATHDLDLREFFETSFSLSASASAASASAMTTSVPGSARRPFSTPNTGLLSPSFGIATNGMIATDSCEPPPLPPKKKHVMAYMQMFGSCMQQSYTDYPFSGGGTFNYHHREVAVAHQAIGIVSSTDDSVFFETAFAMRHDPSESSCSAPADVIIVGAAAAPALPPKRMRSIRQSVSIGSVSPSSGNGVSSSCSTEDPAFLQHGNTAADIGIYSTGACDADAQQPHFLAIEPSPALQDNSSAYKGTLSDSNSPDIKILDEIDVKSLLIYKKEGEDGPDIRGGSVDALIVHATMASKNDFTYQEAFLTTYRTFILSIELINKLLYRYNKFGHMTEVSLQRIARNSFSLLVRVVDDFSVTDLSDEVVQILVGFVFQLLCNGDLMLARALRKKILEKYWIKRNSNPVQSPLSSKGISTKQASLLDFKSEQLAEQMTLLDADLFQKIEIPEVLIWARLQKEEFSINLTTFTEHFNKMSYWARSRILEQDEAKDRERYVVKFIKIMKHLRKMNNFNSYLAILSALDSAPIRRLEWQKHITEGLKEYCELIDSSSSFRAYRQALAETEPPCIPYIGLILQDLTFVHIGNSDLLTDGNVNFAKRWQQFNILDSMRRFKKCQYGFKRSERIMAFFNNFDDHLCEEAMWQISEGIKPRGARKKTDQAG